MLPFSTEARKLLEAAGWTDDRRIDVSEYEPLIRQWGYPYTPPIQEFIGRFGGLYIPLGGQSAGDWVEFDLEGALSGFQNSNLTHDVKKTGVPITPVGETDWGYAYISLGAGGEFYVRYQVSMVKLGTNWIDGLDALLTGNPEVGFTYVFGAPPPELKARRPQRPELSVRKPKEGGLSVRGVLNWVRGRLRPSKENDG
jgi:hypothetical protein